VSKSDEALLPNASAVVAVLEDLSLPRGDFLGVAIAGAGAQRSFAN